MDKWLTIWREKGLKPVQALDERTLFLALKEANGFDVVEGGLEVSSFLKQFDELMDEFSYYETLKHVKVNSIYEVGCGSGANLLFFARKGYKVGGYDYSSSLINLAHTYLGKYTNDLSCEEAIYLSELPLYDVVLSNSVFGYFPTYAYARKVLDKMYKKSTGLIALLDIHDLEKESAYYRYRKETIPNFEELYEGLPKLFYPKSFFEKFAKDKGMQVKFIKTEIPEYWNNDYVYSCYLYK